MNKSKNNSPTTLKTKIKPNTNLNCALKKCKNIWYVKPSWSSQTVKIKKKQYVIKIFQSIHNAAQDAVDCIKY